MPLPFKERPYLPDNKQLAIVWLSHLKRKLLKDEKYKERYLKRVMQRKFTIRGRKERNGIFPE